MRVRGVNIKVLTCWHFIRERYFMTTQEKQKKLSLRACKLFCVSSIFYK